MQLHLDTAQFLRDYWQQKPLLIRGGFAQFTDLIEPELLAGLAMEEGVDARVIQHQNEQWHVEHGPFEDYSAFGEEGWTLLVQAVNEWFPDVQDLLRAFTFIPDWRVDDVMVSFATEHGGVGAHLDQYDVFIIQGGGRRHWRVGAAQANAEEYCPHPDLKQLKRADFDAVIDAVLEPGDILYIPAGCPHHGVALEPSINYSVGFRAPNTAEWFAQLADQLLATDATFARYRDPDLTVDKPSYLVDNAQLQQLQQLLVAQLQQPETLQALVQVMSQSKRPLPQSETELSSTELLSYAATEMFIGRTPGARVLTNEAGQVFANGELLVGLEASTPAVQALLLLKDEVPLADCTTLLNDTSVLNCLCELIQQGVFYLVQDADDEATA